MKPFNPLFFSTGMHIDAPHFYSLFWTKEQMMEHINQLCPHVVSIELPDIYSFNERYKIHDAWTKWCHDNCESYWSRRGNLIQMPGYSFVKTMAFQDLNEAVTFKLIMGDYCAI